MKVLVCGDRHWTWAHVAPIRAHLAALVSDEQIVIIHGGAPGVDSIAHRIARQLGYSVQVYPADWHTYGNAAGPIRNRLMLDQQPDLVLAFHPNLAESKGTADTVREARRRGIPVEVITGHDTDQMTADIARRLRERQFVREVLDF